MSSRLQRAFCVPFLLALTMGVIACGPKAKSPSIVIAKDASSLERYAAAELKRYIYLRTGDLPSVLVKEKLEEAHDNAIILAGIGRSFSGVSGLGPEEYRLKTVSRDGGKSVVIAGGDGPGVLYGTYMFLEKLGIRFYLEGDVVPDERIRFSMPDLDEAGRPLFAVRGIQPFHDFPEGPDWWDVDNYKAILGQLPKLRMNFFGLHTYPEKGPNAEPTVWIGCSGDSQADGVVTSSYPSSYQNSLRGNWGYEPRRTGDYHFGASMLFERDDYGNDVMEGMVAEPKTPDASNAVFNRAAAVFKDAFGFARALGVKTCVGTETVLTVPDLVRQRLRDEGKEPRDPAVVRELYKGIFSRIAAAYPIDTYWLWTDESWTWSDASAERIKAVVSDLEQAVAAHRESGVPFGLATCGWVLGPPSSRTLFDQVLPKSMAVSTINREVGKAPVDPGFARIAGRSKWAIPWMEDDPSLTSPQLWAGRMRRDAADALRYGCDGLLGIHWRTRVLSGNVLALARAAWDQSWNKLPRNLMDETGPITGQYVAFQDKKIQGTAEEAVYRDVRNRVFAYYIPVPDGTYAVTLKFCEGEIDKKGGRVFDILLQGKKAAEAVDIFARVGRFRALDLTFRGVAVTDGRLAVEFADRIHYPSLAGIVIEGKSFRKKINCGGPEVLDYEADWPETPRHLPALDFYRDWAENQFGKAAFEEAAAIFARMDGCLPIPVVWTNGPGGIVPNLRPREEILRDYSFVDEFAALGAGVTGKGYQERFDYWLKSFEYMREVALFTCLWGEYNAAMEKVNSEKDGASRTKLAEATALPARVRMAASLKKIYECLLATVSNTGEMGTIMNWESHILPAAFDKPGDELARVLGRELPEEARLATAYEGPPRVFVTAQRTSLEPGERLKLKVEVLTRGAPAEVNLFWRDMGKGRYQSMPLTRLGRGVYTVTCPAKDVELEYYVKVTAEGREVFWPATAPETNQTVVIFGSPPVSAVKRTT